MTRLIPLRNGQHVASEKHGYRNRLYFNNRYIGSYFPKSRTWGWMEGERRMHGDAHTLRDAAEAAYAAMVMRGQTRDVYRLVEVEPETIDDLLLPEDCRPIDRVVR